MNKGKISVAKYMCSCGYEFKKKNGAEMHVQVAKDHGLTNHFVITKHWRVQLLEWFLNLPGRKITRTIGIYLVYIITINHFHVEWSFLEALVLGIGLGLAIE
jgi:hypothetical protein